jgi:4-alpha-glucanotransferase
LSQDPQNFAKSPNETDQVVDASVRYLGHTRAPLVLLPLEDAWAWKSRPTCPAPPTPIPTGAAACRASGRQPARQCRCRPPSRTLAVARNQAHERDR